jgi:hypothetical protein
MDRNQSIQQLSTWTESMQKLESKKNSHQAKPTAKPVKVEEEYEEEFEAYDEDFEDEEEAAPAPSQSKTPLVAPTNNSSVKQSTASAVNQHSINEAPTLRAEEKR